MARETRTRLQRAAGMVKAVRDACGFVIDQVVMAVSPEAGARRSVMRDIVRSSEVRLLARREEERDSVSSDSRLHGDQRWLGHRLSPDSELELDLESSRQRSLELYRDTTAGGAIETKIDHIVGSGFTYRPKIAEQTGITKAQADNWNTQILDVHNRWSQRCDITGKQSLWQSSRLVQRCVEYAGESFTILWYKQRPGQPIPLTLEVVDADRICTPTNRTGDPFCRMGIQYANDGSGEIIGYWVRTTNPYDTRQVEYKWIWVPAERMLHVYEAWFPQQSRGYPWMQRTLDRHRDGEDLDEAGIIAAQVEACNAAFVRTKRPTTGSLKAAAAITSNGYRLQDIRPGTINYLDADSEEILFNNPTKSNIVGTLHEWNYRRIAAGSDWPYEFLMKDWRGVSFAGGRIVLNGVRIKCGVAQKLLDVAWLMQISNAVVDQAVLFGVVDINVSAYQQKPWIYQAHRWTPPKFNYALNPGEEINAAVMAVENNITTLDETVADRGDNLDEVLAQREKECRDQEGKDIIPAARLTAMGQLGKAESGAAGNGTQQGNGRAQDKEQSDATV